MLELLNNFIITLMDYVLGWMLHLPNDVALGIVAVATACLLTLVRPFTTNQELLRRCKADKKRLKVFIKQAKSQKDKESLARYRATVTAIGMKSMAAEGKPLLVAVVPIVLLAVWALGRLGFEAPQSNAPVTVRAYFPASAIDNLVHIIPADGLSAPQGYVQRITEEPPPGPSLWVRLWRWVLRTKEDPPKDPNRKVNGWATWQLEAPKSEKPYEIQIRYQGKIYTKEMLVDGQRYSPLVQFYDDPAIQGVQLDLPAYKPFGVVPGMPWLLLDPWIVGYLLIAVPVVFVLKWALKIN